MNRRMTTKRWFLAVALAVPCLAVGCASEPTSEIEAADAALASARQAEAADYAPDAMEAAEEARQALQTELDAQKESFAMSRSYDKAKELAGEAQRLSENAAEAAVAGKDQAREDASALLAELQVALEETNTMLAKAPSGKGSAADLAMMRGDLGAIEDTVAEIEQAIAEERYMDALQKADASMANTNEIRAELERASRAQLMASNRRG